MGRICAMIIESATLVTCAGKTCVNVRNAGYELRRMVDVHIWVVQGALTNSAGVVWPIDKGATIHVGRYALVYLMGCARTSRWCCLQWSLCHWFILLGQLLQLSTTLVNHTNTYIDYHIAGIFGSSSTSLRLSAFIWHHLWPLLRFCLHW